MGLGIKPTGVPTWNDDLIWKIYELRRGGLESIDSCAKALGSSYVGFTNWLKKKPAFKAAFDAGWAARGGGGEAARFPDYVYQRLPPKLQRLWDEIYHINNQADGPMGDRAEGYRLVHNLLKDRGDRVRQHLYMFALCTSCFNPSEAMRQTLVTKAMLKRWERDPDFAELVEEVHHHKKNFFEGGLVRLVAAGDAGATIFANRTLNRDRGYGEKSVVEISGSIQHEHKLVGIEELNLPLDIMRVVLQRLRAYNEERGVVGLPGTVVDQVLEEEKEEVE